jgi:PTH1 family peptidyl-tRNA hydrolase
MQHATIQPNSITAIIGLGNPGNQYQFNRHNIGFRVLDALANAYGAHWTKKEEMEIAFVHINNVKVLLVKPLTFMNSSGLVVPQIKKQGINPDKILVVHDELELPFGQIKFKIGGSHKGHNGLRSIIACCGDGFARLRFGIGRPEHKEQVPDYVLENFKEPKNEVERLIHEAVGMIERLYLS